MGTLLLMMQITLTVPLIAASGVHLAAEGLEDSEDDGPPLRDMIRRTMNSVLNKSQQEYAKVKGVLALVWRLALIIFTGTQLQLMPLIAGLITSTQD